jgi:hypothetical protein
MAATDPALQPNPVKDAIELLELPGFTFRLRAPHVFGVHNAHMYLPLNAVQLEGEPKPTRHRLIVSLTPLAQKAVKIYEKWKTDGKGTSEADVEKYWLDVDAAMREVGENWKHLDPGDDCKYILSHYRFARGEWVRSSGATSHSYNRHDTEEVALAQLYFLFNELHRMPDGFFLNIY